MRNETLPAWKSLLAGGIAGSVAKTFVGPFDRVKILYQARNPQYIHHSSSLTGVFRVVKSIGSTSGIRGLYRGHSIMLLRIFPYAAIHKLFAGSFAGATAVMFTYPFDMLRARLAYQLLIHKEYSVLRTIKAISKEHRVPLLSFYKGFAPSLYGIVPYAGIAFFTFESIKSLLSNPQNGEVTAIQKFICGFIAGACGQTAAYPFDVVRRRMQLVQVAHHLPKYKSTFDALRLIVSTEGIRGLFLGISINYLKVAPATGISFLVYETVKKYLTE